MRIELKIWYNLFRDKLGTKLLRLFNQHCKVKPDEDLEIDFTGVLTFSPSWGMNF